MFTLFVNHAVAVPGLTTYQAKIIKPDGIPLEASGVNFRFTILNPAGSCVLYIEDYSSVNMTSTAGLISFSLGTGTKIYPTSGTTTFADVFSNATPSIACQGSGNFNPSANDVRKIVMQFNDSTGWQTLPAMNINAVPYAMYANRADNSTLFNSKADTAFVQYSAIPTCSASQALQYTGSGFVCIAAGGGGGASYTVTSSDVTAALGYTPANAATLSTSYTTTASFSTVTATVNSLGSSVTAVTSTVNGLAASLAAITSSQWLTSGTTLSYSGGNVGIGTQNPQTSLDVAGVVRSIQFETYHTGPSFILRDTDGTGASATADVRALSSNGSIRWMLADASGNLRLENRTTGGKLAFETENIERMTILSDGKVGINTLTPTTMLDVSGAIRISMDSVTCAASYAGAIRYNSGIVEYCNGTTWGSFSSGSVTSSSVVSALGYTPANSATVASLSSSLTTITNAQGSSITTLNNSYATLSSSYSALAASMSAMSVSSSQWTTTGADIYYNTGNVGIGKSAPSYRLDVSGTSRISGQALFGNTAASGTFDFGGILGGVVSYKAPMMLQETMTDLDSSNYNFGSGVAIKLNPSGAQNTAFGNMAFVQTDPTNSATYGGGVYGQYGIVEHRGAGTVGLVTGAGGLAINNSSGTVNELYGVYGRTYIVAGAVFNSSGGDFTSMNTGTTPVTNNFGVRINTNGGSFVNNYGLYVGDQSSGVTSATNSYNIFSDGNTSRNVFMGFMGVGVNNPTARIQIAAGTNGNAPLKFTSGLLLTTPASGSLEYDGTSLYFTNGTNTRRAIITGTSSSITSSTITSALGYTPVSAAAASQWTTSATTINYLSGNVGIGTSNPTNILSVQQGNGNDAIMSLTNTSAGKGSYIGASGLSNYVGFTASGVGATWFNGMYGSTNYVIADLTNSKIPVQIQPNTPTSTLTLTASGNVGIGTSAPTVRLQIAGDDLDYNLLLDNYSNTTGSRATAMMFRRALGTQASPAAVSAATVLGGLYFEGYHSGGAFSGNTAAVRALAEENFTASAQGTSLYFRTTPTSSTAMQDSMVIKANGNVGIGTTTPSYKVQIADTTATDTVVAIYGLSTQQQGINVGTSATDRWSIVHEASNGLVFYADHTGDGGAAAGSRMIIKENGSVGIGTTTPSTLNGWGKVLDVAGTAHSKIVATQDTAGVSVTTGIFSHGLTGNGYGGYVQGYGGVGLVGTETYHDLGIITSNTARISITKTGSVGIGNTAPSVNFEVGSSTGGGGTVKINRQNTTGVEGGELQFSPGTLGENVFALDNYQSGASQVLRFRSDANSSIMFLAAGGNVGIGHANPTALLHVNGSALATAWNTSSDSRLKTNIKKIENPVEKILQLRGVEFDWRKDVNQPTLHVKAHDIGVIAQETEKQFPEAVTTNPDGYKSVAYSKLVAPLIEAVKELYYKLVGHDAVLEKHEREIASVKAESAAKDQKIKELEERLEKIEKALQQQQQNK